MSEKLKKSITKVTDKVIEEFPAAMAWICVVGATAAAAYLALNQGLAKVISLPAIGYDTVFATLVATRMVLVYLFPGLRREGD